MKKSFITSNVPLDFYYDPINLKNCETFKELTTIINVLLLTYKGMHNVCWQLIKWYINYKLYRPLRMFQSGHQSNQTIIKEVF